LRIRNWDKFQHYKPMHSKYKKQMTWLKLYGGDILNDIDWFELSDTNKAIYIELLCLASQNHGNLPELKTIAFRLRRSKDQLQKAFDELSHWIEDGIYSVYTMPIPEEEKEEEENKKSIQYDYSLFDKFWEEVIPSVRKYGKQSCKNKWKSHDLNKEATQIFAWYKKMQQTEEWKKGMIPAPEVVINQRRWEAEVPGSTRQRYDWEGAK
jgi:hypothetical protein